MRFSDTRSAMSVGEPPASATTCTSNPSLSMVRTGKTVQTSLVTPATTSFLRPVARTAPAKASSSIALTMPMRLMRLAKASGAIVASSASSGPCTNSSMLEVSTIGIRSILADFASMIVFCFMTSKGMDRAQPIVPVW